MKEGAKAILIAGIFKLAFQDSRVGLQDDNVALKIQLFTTQSSLINYLRVTRKHSYLIVNVHEPHSIGHVIRKHERGYESEHST